MKTVTIIDYGRSNLLSVCHAFEYFGVEVNVTSSPKDIATAHVLVLPGVGAFQDGMDGLRRLNLVGALNDAVKSGIPLLGICLGMQMLFDQSEEFGIHDGLGYIPGKVVRIPQEDTDGKRQKIPHISWNPLLPIGEKGNFSDTILSNVSCGEECYFIHSYEAVPTNTKNRIADTVYGGRKLCAVAQNGNVIGMQFHPEKSGRVGLRIIEKFIEIY